MGNINTSAEYELLRGPQDGAKVKTVGGFIPTVIFVGKQYRGDGFAAWGKKASARFPCQYVFDRGRFVFYRFVDKRK